MKMSRFHRENPSSGIWTSTRGKVGVKNLKTEIRLGQRKSAFGNKGNNITPRTFMTTT